MKLMKKLVIHGLKLNKKRTIVTVIGIILAVALLSALSTLVSSFRGSLIHYERNKSGNFHVSFMNMEEQDRMALYHNRQIENVFEISELGYAKLDGCKNKDKPYAFVVATDENGLENGAFQMIEGRLPQNSNEIVIPKHLQTNGRLVYEVGEEITLSVGTRTFLDGTVLGQDTPFTKDEEERITDVTPKTYTIVGIMERPGLEFEQYTAPGYTFLTYQKKATKEVTTNTYIRFTSKGLRNYMDYTADIIGVDREVLKAVYSFVEDDYEAMSEEELSSYAKEMEKQKYIPNFNIWLIRYERIWPVEDTFKIILFLAGVVAIIIILTSVYCIKNSFDISVNEKIHLYGMLAGIGATKKQIRKSVYHEASILGALGIPLGVLGGLFAAYILIKVSNTMLAASLNTELEYVPSWIAILFAIALGAITIWLSSARSAYKAGKVSPIEAIRNQKEIKLNAKKIKAPKYIKKIWGIGGVISYKNIKRNKKKYRTTVVSIVICTVTFIVVSYFMSMGFSMVGTEVANESANVYFRADSSISYEQIEDSLFGIDGIKRFGTEKRTVVYLDDFVYTEEYVKYIKTDDPDYYDLYYKGEFTDHMQVGILDDASFAKYAKECGIKDEIGKVIFFNLEVRGGEGELQKFKLSSNVIEAYREDDSEVEFDENDNLIEESIKKIPARFELAGTTTERPFGLKSANAPMLIMSESTFAQMGDFYQLVQENVYQMVKFEAEDADALQEDLEKMIMDNPTLYSGTSSVSNVESDIKAQRSVLTLLSIFAYGLIVVIALIGITNIFNTLSASMELRARDFATLRSIGMTNKQFGRMIRLESLFTSAKSLFFGCVIGFVISFFIWKIETMMDVAIVFHPPIKSIVICIAVVLVLVYAIIRASLMKINKRNIIETIKNENV